MHGKAEVGGVPLDLGDGPELARLHDLVLVEQEDRHSGGGNQFVDLRPASAELGFRVPVYGGLADAVCLVEDQDVEIVGLGVHELVEVLEHPLHALLASAGDLAKGLGERARAGRVKHAATAAGEFAEQRQRDDALAAAWTAGDDDDGLLVCAARALDLVQDHRMRQLLLRDEDELLAPLDLVRCDRE